MPNWMQAAIEGNSDYAKFLTDIHGNDLNLQPSDNLPIIESQTGHQGQMTLSANGILFFTGYNNYGYSGNGQTRNYGYPVPVSFYDTDRSTALTGANRPKVKMYHWSMTKSDTNTSYASVFVVDTEGFLYTCGYNAHKQLRTGNTTNSQYLSRIPKSFFGNRPIVYVTSSSCQYPAVYAITDDGRCWTWGQNDNGQLANDNETDQDTPVDITSVSGSPLNGKRIRHVMGSDGNANTTRIWFLTTDGEVFTCGHNESYGNYTGAITSNSNTDLDLPTALTDAATTINSDGQKVVAMYTTGGRYCTSWFITDGGNSGESASKCYACGNNSEGEMGAGADQADGNAAGNWRLKEIEFDSGPADTFTTAATDSVTGTRSTFLSGGSNQNRMKIGRIVKVQGHGWGSNTGIPVSALDEFGQMWITGEWNSMIYSKYYNRDDDEDFQGSNDYTTRFIKMYSQPEPFIDFCFYNRNTEGEVAMMAIGESGQLYLTGYGGWNNLGNEVDYTMDNWTVPHKL
jgi:alpha-tubulin suppressor-like RCC1 family protein